MKKIYLSLALLFLTFACYSQVIVSATGGVTTATPYSRLGAAFDAINTGVHQGIISINVTGNTTETSSAVLNATLTGASSYFALSIQAPGTIERIISGNISGPLIDLNGATNVTIDGSNTSGTSSLTLINTYTGNTNNTSTVRFINDASNNVVKFAKIQGASTSTTSGTIFFDAGSLAGNNNNTVMNCNIADASGSFPLNAIFALGSLTTGMENSNITISNNNISNFFNEGLSTSAISVLGGNTNWHINNNRFFQTAARTFTTGNPQRIIQITSGNNYEIKGNIIGYSSETGTGIYTIGGAVSTRFLAIDLTVGSATPSVVQENRVSDMSYTTSNNSSSATGVWCAINIAGGHVNVTGNTIGSTTGSGNITISPTVAGTLSVPITTSSTGIVNITNNSIGAINVLPSAALSGNMTGIQTQGALGTISITNNTIGNNSANNMRVGTLGTTTGNGIIRGINNQNNGTFTIAGNAIRNLTHNSNNALALFRALEIQQGAGSIRSNNISDIAANGTSTSVLNAEGAGILVTSAGEGITIDSNTVSNLSVVNSTTTSGITVMGIYLGSNVNGPTITRNRIFGVSNASTSTSTGLPGITVGIYLRDANTANPVTVANNMVSLGNSQSTNTSMIGIWNGVNSTTGYVARIYYNTINIEGTAAAGAQPSFGYLRGDFASTAYAGPVVDIRNNIFTNNRTGGTGKHYAIANSYAAATSSGTGWTSDYNILNANAATIGYWSADQTFAGWKVASSNDVQSYSGVAVTYANSASDLHLVTTTGTNGAADGKATPITGFKNDFDNDVRSAVSPDLGADEFIQGTLSIAVEFLKGKKQANSNLIDWKAGCSSTSVKFDIERSNDGRVFQSIGSVTASQARCALPFNFSDVSPARGINYYRLKMTEIDGKVTYSFVIAILNKEDGFEVVGISPTLVENGRATLNVTSAQKSNVGIVVTDVSGRTFLKKESMITAGSDTIQLNLNMLSAGVYFLTVYSDYGEAKTLRFVKR